MDKKNLRIAFMGTPEISAVVLEKLIKEEYDIVLVIAQCDKPVGRNNVIEEVPTKKIAQKYGIPCFQPIKIRNDYQTLVMAKPDIIITLAYGQIVPQEVLDIPRLGCLNLHGSILPKYRGAAPIQYALFNGEKKTGVTLMQMIAKMDAGLMYAFEEVDIHEDDNATSLFAKIGDAAGRLIVRELPNYVDGVLIGIQQNDNEATFCPTIKKEEEHLDTNLSPVHFVNRIRGLSEIPGGYLVLGEEKIKIFKAEVANYIQGDIGKIIEANKNQLLLQVNGGQVQLLELQKPGKKKMGYRDFINGVPNLLGQILK